jgi:hypothetical protein
MKAKDIGVLAVVGIVSAVFSYFLSSLLISSSEDRKATVEVVAPISAEFTRPDTKYFNASSVNPTQNIVVEPITNPNPFGN